MKEEKNGLAVQNSSPPLTADVEQGSIAATALDPFGKPLEPRPTTDSFDPLNWPNSRKYSIIAIVCLSYFLMIYAVAAPIVSFTQLQTKFNATYTEINWTFAITNLGTSVGPLFHSSLGDIIGRRTVLILGTALSIVATGCSALPNITIEGYSAARFFQVFGATPAITIGLAIINDLSWQHERGFRVGLWVLSIDIGSYLGPFCTSFPLFTSAPPCLTQPVNNHVSWCLRCQQERGLDATARLDIILCFVYTSGCLRSRDTLSS